MGRGAIDTAMNLLEMALASRPEVLTISTAGWRALCCSGCLLRIVHFMPIRKRQEQNGKSGLSVLSAAMLTHLEDTRSIM